jgi:hypothetical protein
MPNSNPPTRPVGRPTKYDARFAKVAEKMCQLGAIDRDLATAFDVDLSTIQYWKSTRPAFAAALKIGKEAVDDQVERSLFQNAVGFVREVTKVNVSEGQLFETKILETIPPDTKAAALWLANRRPAVWALNPTRRITLPLGNFEGAAGLTTAMTGIARALAAGLISPQDAEAMGRVVDALGDAYGRHIIEERVLALEDKRERPA